jgi:hypothetical protein
VVLRQPDGIEAEFFGKHHLVDFVGQDFGARAAWRRLEKEIRSEAHGFSFFFG